MVHSASQTEIQTHHVNAVRLLFEGYLEAYIKFYDINELDVFETTILSLEPNIQARAEKIESLKEEIRTLERAQEFDFLQNERSFDNIKNLHRKSY